MEKIITKDFQNDVEHNITKVTPWKEIQAWNFMSMAFLGDEKMQKESQFKRRNMSGHYLMYISCILLIQPQLIFEEHQEWQSHP